MARGRDTATRLRNTPLTRRERRNTCLTCPICVQVRQNSKHAAAMRAAARKTVLLERASVQKKLCLKGVSIPCHFRDRNARQNFPQRYILVAGARYVS